MKRQLSTRILSLILSFVMFVSCFPVAYAAEVEETVPVSVATEPVETEMPAVSEAEQTDPSEENTETPEETTQATEITEPSGETEAAEVTEPVEEETVPAETIPEETIPEETAAEEQAFVFAGMPEDYILSEELLAEKQLQIELGVLENLEALIPGEDYVADEVLTFVETEEEAAVVAAAFNGEVSEYFDGFVVIRLLESTVLEAMTASLDLAQNLPVVSPNYIYREEPVEIDYALGFNSIVPEKQTWETWVQENGYINDTFLQDPTDDRFQYFHDVIDSYAAWGVTTGAKWVKVGLIDSGVRTSHEELTHVIDRNIYKENNSVVKGDTKGHGTQMAGIITAKMGNGKGGVGIAPDVTVYSYGIGPDPTSSLRIQAINKAIVDKVHVVNMSLGDINYNYSENVAITNALDEGITIVASAGNDRTNTIRYPGAMDGVICVAATDKTGGRAFYSNYGSWVDISAPGDNICSPNWEGNNLYSSGGGTSQAAAVVTGVVALYTSAMGDRVAPATVEAVMKKTATKISDSGMGAGIVNIGNMLGTKPEAPTYQIVDEYGNLYKTGATVPCESKLYFTPAMDGDESGFLLYTDNGKTPSIKNGEVVNGKELVGEIDLAPFAGTTVTFKVAHVSGVGLIGNTTSVKVTVAKSAKITGITINGAAQVIAGKSCTYTAEVAPVDTAEQKVTWKIVESTDIAKIDANSGKLTTKSGRTGEITIRATSAVNPNKTRDMQVSIISGLPVNKITLNDLATKTFFVGETGRVSVQSMVDKNGNSVYPRPNVRWTSSNKKVLTVDSNGNFQALAKGQATITCLSLDGSGKTAKVTITVKQPVEEITITGSQVSIAPGYSATFKASVFPSTANNKKVTWHLYNAPAGVTINPSNGKVSVASYVPEGSYFYVYAQATDYPSAADNVRSWMERIYVYKKCTGVYIEMEAFDVGKAPGIDFNKNDTVKTINLFSVDLPDTDAVEDSIELCPTYSGDAMGNYVEFTSSKPDVVSVDGFRLTAHKAGSATITLKALDGSGKKASCTVKVTNPVSSLSIRTATELMSDDQPYLNYGKSVKNTVTFADTYGVPTNKKVNWSFKVVTYDSNGKNGDNLTETLKQAKLVTLSNGTLTVKKGAEEYSKGEMKIWVYAESADGTEYKAEQIYYVIPPTTTLYMKGNYLPVYDTGTKLHVYAFYSDQHNLYNNAKNCGFTATSSNPNIAGVVAIQPGEKTGQYALCFYTYGKKGNAKITIKTNDGSKKSYTFQVDVK